MAAIARFLDLSTVNAAHTIQLAQYPLIIGRSTPTRITEISESGGLMAQFTLRTFFLGVAVIAAWSWWYANRTQREHAAHALFASRHAVVTSRPRTLCGVRVGTHVTRIVIRDRLREQRTVAAAHRHDPTDPEVGRPKSRTALDVYRLAGVELTDWRRLADFPSLMDLTLDGNSVTDAHLKEVGALTQLKSLRLLAPLISSRGIERLRTLTKLESLELNCAGLTDSDLASVLSSFRSLRTLKLEGRVGTKCASAICLMSDITDLYIRSCCFIASDARILRDAPSLKSITILGDIPDTTAVTSALRRDNPRAAVVIVDAAAVERHMIGPGP